MFTYIKLKNFLSLGDVIFDFRKKQTKINNIAVIYGENGSGKTNFVQAFYFLYNAFNSFSFRQKYDSFISFYKENDIPIPTDIKQSLYLFSDYTEYLSSQRMIECDEPSIIEYGFIVDGREAIYHVSFTDRIIEEYLYSFTGKQRGMLFYLSSGEKEQIKYKLQSELILQTAYKKEIVEKIRQYWGKHTFLSIITKQIHEKNERFIEESISQYLLMSLGELSKFSITSKVSNKNEQTILYKNDIDILTDFESGTVPKSLKNRIDRTSEILRDFFTQTYADIKDVEYEMMETSDNKIKYQLFVIKMINGKLRKIKFNQESAGTQQVLEIIRSIIGLFFGVTVIYDEIDNGVHDILLTHVIKSLEGEISGQLIITTHNTMLLEEMDEHCVYIINTDYMGNKSVHCAAEYGIQTNHNLRARYLKGLLGGVPYIDGVDYEGIESILAERGDPSWQEKPDTTM